MRKPLIGITCNFDPKDTVGMTSFMGIAGQDWDFVAGDYVYSIEAAGGIPVLLPRTLDAETLKRMVDSMDGILVSGGHDVDPSDYGARIEGYCGRIVPERDAYDLAITHYAYETGKPILGICRGIQIMNAAFGGTLYQDLEREGGFKHHFMDNSPRQCPVHSLSITEGSILSEVFGTTLKVNSYHHQAVRDVAPNATVTAVSDDGVIEAEEFSGGHPFVVGVQWHPEMMFPNPEQGKLFTAFVKACMGE